MGWNQESITKLFQKKDKKSVEIIKAVDENTKYDQSTSDMYLYSIIPFHVENLNGNLYNLKLTAKLYTSITVKNVFINVQFISNDADIFKKSKYYVTNIDKLTLHNVYKQLYGKETQDNSYRTDLCVHYGKTESGFYQIHLVENATNTVYTCYLSKEYFFKLAIFQWYFLCYGIIDGDILVRKFTDFNLVAIDKEDKEKIFYKYRLLSMEFKTEIFTFYWNNFIIIANIDQDNSTSIDYLMLTKDEFKEFTDKFNEKQVTMMKVGEYAT